MSLSQMSSVRSRWYFSCNRSWACWPSGLGSHALIGQILAGILLGPTLLGEFPGDLTVHLFPKATLLPMNVLANIAVVIFMFVVGYELDFRSLRGTRRAAAMVAGGALLIPMALGVDGVRFQGGFRPGGRSPVSVVRALHRRRRVDHRAAGARVDFKERRHRGDDGRRHRDGSGRHHRVLAWLVLAAALVGTVHKPGRPLAVTAVLIAAFAAAMLGDGAARPCAGGSAEAVPAVETRCPSPSRGPGQRLGYRDTRAASRLGGFLASLDHAKPRRGARTPDPAPHGTARRSAAAAVLRGHRAVAQHRLRSAQEAFAMLALVCIIASVGKVGPAYAASRAGG